MNIQRTSSLIALSVLAAAGTHADAAAVRLTAMQIISTDAAGKIQGVGAHRFRTANHGGHPAIFLVRGDDLDGAIINGPVTAQNGIDLAVPVGTHTYFLYAEKTNSYTWTNYTLNLFFDQSNTAQVSALTAMNTSSQQFFPPIAANTEFTENLQGHQLKASGSLVYKSGQTEVRLTDFHFSAPAVYSKDRVAPFEVRKNNVLDYVGEFTVEVKAPPEISNGGVVNGASFSNRVSPGSLFSIFGSSLATAARSATSVPLPMNLQGTTVTVGGRTAPLVYVSSDQVNAQIPYEIQENPSVPVIVTVNGVASAAMNVAVVPAAPGIFQYGVKRAVVQNEDYTTNTVDNGARGDSYVTAYLTGSGPLDNAVPTGAPAKASPLSRTKGQVTASIDGNAVEVVFAGMTPEFIGLMQVNLKVPMLSPGTYPLVISINEARSNAAMITIK